MSDDLEFDEWYGLEEVMNYLTYMNPDRGERLVREIEALRLEARNNARTSTDPLYRWTFHHYDGVTLWECPGCGFRFDAIHEEEGGGYVCPSCGWN